MQQELFKEFASANKRPKKKSNASILPKNYILFNVSYEQIVFIAIGIIMLMVFVFSLGVEKGRHMAYKPTEPQKNVAVTAHGAVESKKPSEQEKIEQVNKQETKKAEKTSNAGPFTIQIIAYRSKKSAQKELRGLVKKGYNPFVIVGGGYYQICVGGYKTKKEAKKDLMELKKGHPDSFIRKR